MYTEIVYGQTHIPRNNLIVAVLNLGHDEFNINIGIFHEISPFMSAYASSEGSDEPAHPRKIVRALFY